ncbi:DMT family transporter [Frigidibacter sp. MR17.14]
MSPAADRILAGMGLMVAFCLIAPLIDVSSKAAAQQVPVSTVTFGRFLVQGALMAPVVALIGPGFGLSRRAFWLTLARGVCGIVSTFCFVAAVQVMPIADALAIAFVEPFVILLIGRFAMGEEVGPRRLTACAVGFAGALMVIQPSFAAFGAVALFPLGTAVTFALYMLVTRRLSRELHPIPMQFWTAVLAGAACLPLMMAGHASGIPAFDVALPQSPAIWGWCFGVGLAATISHMAITYGLKFAPSATLAPLHYLEIVTATLFGYLFFGDFPGGLTWAGIGVIVASGLYVIHRERIVARRALVSLPPAAH